MIAGAFSCGGKLCTAVLLLVTHAGDPKRLLVREHAVMRPNGGLEAQRAFQKSSLGELPGESLSELANRSAVEKTEKQGARKQEARPRGGRGLGCK